MVAEAEVVMARVGMRLVEMVETVLVAEEINVAQQAEQIEDADEGILQRGKGEG